MPAYFRTLRLHAALQGAVAAFPERVFCDSTYNCTKNNLPLLCAASRVILKLSREVPRRIRYLKEIFVMWVIIIVGVILAWFIVQFKDFFIMLCNDTSTPDLFTKHGGVSKMDLIQRDQMAAKTKKEAAQAIKRYK